MSRRTLLPALLIVVAIGLTGCTAPMPSRSVGDVEGVEDRALNVSALVAGGTAQDNLGYFTRVIALVWQTADRQSGPAYIDALAAAGFDKAAMQLTSDTSTVGNPAESFQFSVRWGADCLIGQVGPATGEPYAVVVPGIAQSTCLIGETVALG